MSLCSSILGCNPENKTVYSRDQDLVYTECQDCGIIWRDPESFHLEKAYDKQYFDSKDYARNRKHKVAKSGWLLDMVRSISPEIYSILEVGCSLGNALEAAKLRGMESLGIDVSTFAVDYCTRHNLSASNQTLDELVAEKPSYDLIVMQHVLEHFQDPFHVLNMCNKLLARGGLVMILIPNSLYSRATRLRADHKFYSKKGVGLEHFVYFNYQNLTRVLKCMGFRVVIKNYPLRIRNNDTLSFFASRLGRRALSAFNMDQELVLVAAKTDDTNIEIPGETSR